MLSSLGYNVEKSKKIIDGRGGGAGGGAGGASTPPPHFFENYKVTEKKCFQLPHFESLFSPPPFTFKVAPQSLNINSNYSFQF